MVSPKYVRYDDDEWSALYIDGKLDTVGDSYYSDERIAQLLGVEFREGGIPFRGTGRMEEDVIQSLDEAEEHIAAKQEQIELAKELRAQAHVLRTQAHALIDAANKVAESI